MPRPGPAGDDALVVAVQHNLQQQLRVVCRSARLVVGVALLESAQLQMLLDDLAESVLERALDDLVRIRQRDHLRLVQVVGLVPRHRRSSVALSRLGTVLSIRRGFLKPSWATRQRGTTYQTGSPSAATPCSAAR